MAIHIALNHKTHYRYDRPVMLGPQTIRLRPAPHCRTPILAYSLKVLPKNHFINWQQDPQANYLARLVFPEKTTEFLVEVDLVAEMAIFNPFDFFLEPYAEQIPFTYETSLARELRPFLEAEVPGPRLAAFLAQVPRITTPTLDFLVSLNQRVQRDIGYVIRLEQGVQTCEQTLALGTGSCRDSAWLLVQILRNLGLAARFVSGYLIQLTADVKPLEGPAGASSDFTDLHAWTEVYLPGAGWVGFDPTSGLLAGEGHIPLACTPDVGSAAPISGPLEFCKTDFSYSMTVQRIYESPRVTKPYSEQQWEQIEALGHQVDVDLQVGDVRLTMGGEPTFISLDDRNGSEWSTTAMSPAKRRLAVELLLRMRDRFSTGALLHIGQGKWYPGEELPRWALGCYWRKDGVPIWENQSLFAEDGKDYGYGAPDARRFLEALTRRLQVSSLHHHRLRRHLLSPVEGTAAARDHSIRSTLSSKNLPNVPAWRRFLNRPRSSPSALSCLCAASPPGRERRDGPASRGSRSAERMFLTPGDSPMGYRLPLEAMPWTKPEDVTYAFDTDPFRRRDKLPPRPERRMDLFSPPVADDAGARRRQGQTERGRQGD